MGVSIAQLRENIRARPALYIGDVDSGAAIADNLVRETVTKFGEPGGSVSFVLDGDEITLKASSHRFDDHLAAFAQDEFAPLTISMLQCLAALSRRGHIEANGAAWTVAEGRLSASAPTCSGARATIVVDPVFVPGCPLLGVELARAAAVAAAMAPGVSVFVEQGPHRWYYCYERGLSDWLAEWGAPSSGTTPREPVSIEFEDGSRRAIVALTRTSCRCHGAPYFVRSFVAGRETEAGGSHLEGALDACSTALDDAQLDGLILAVSVFLERPRFAGPTRCRLVDEGVKTWLSRELRSALLNHSALTLLTRPH